MENVEALMPLELKKYHLFDLLLSEVVEAGVYLKPVGCDVSEVVLI